MSKLPLDADLSGIAVIGMSCRFPGADNYNEFWENIAAGIEPIRNLSSDELTAMGIRPELIDHPKYVKRSSDLDRIELFDAAFFELTPREASITAPSQRTLLMCAHEAFEDASYQPKTYAGSVGVFVGVNRCDEWQKRLYALSESESGELAKQLQLYIANDLDYSATRISYKLNLTGPSFNVSTACSTSLVAIHQACRSLLSYECDMALAGGASIVLPQGTGYLYEPGGIQSSDGRCRAFDAKADGTIFGNGAGIVLLKRLEEAVADRDHIHAIIRGSAINNDGSAKVGYTAPSVSGQSNVIAAALAVADIHPEAVSYVETHGTGTSLGDPIEVEALSKAYRARTRKKTYCALGSVKTNIGHLGSAAGVAGFIKTVQALKNRKIPPNLHFESANREIDFQNSPFFVSTKLESWAADDGPRYAGVSSFGVGGTNAHAILEEANFATSASASRSRKLLVLSAKSEAALAMMGRNLASKLAADTALELADVAFSLNTGRERLPFRRACVVATIPEAIDKLAAPSELAEPVAKSSETPAKIAFMFPGQGSQHVNMGRDLYQGEPIFRAVVDQCAEILQPLLQQDIRDLLYPELGGAEQSEQILQQTRIAQPALFVVEYGLARLWQSWGVRADRMIGHSIGEYVAACLAGVFSLKDALYLVVERGRIMQSMPAGTMLAVSMSEKDLLPLLDECDLAAVNAPQWCVASGTDLAIRNLQAKLTADGVSCRPLHTSHAFHSAMMDPALTDYLEMVRSIKLNPPTMRFISNVSGNWITAAEATDPAYWVRQLRRAVRFHDGVQNILDGADVLLLEVGPGQTLSALVKSYPRSIAGNRSAASCRQAKQERNDLDVLLHALGMIWCAGVSIDWRAFYKDEIRSKVSLPTYPFEGKRHWLERRIDNRSVTSRPVGVSISGTDSDIASGGAPDAARGIVAKLNAASASERPALLERFVRMRVCALFGTDEIDNDTALIELGMSSLMAIELRTQINAALGADHISVVQLLDEDATITHLASCLCESHAAATGAADPASGIAADLPESAPESVSKHAVQLGGDDDSAVNFVPSSVRITPDPANQYSPFPLTDIQQAYWIGRHGANGGDGVATYAYIETEIRGLDLAAYERSLNQMIRRHHMLRMVVRPDGTQQFLQSVPEYKIAFQDMSADAEKEAQRKLAAVRERMSHQVLDPAVWPLFEVCISRTTGDVYRLHYGFDFMIVDVLSLLVFFRDMFLLYIGEEKRLTPLEINYRDYVLIEKAGRDSEQYQKSRRYWLDRVGSLPVAPVLPFTQEPTQILAPRYVRRDFEIDGDTWSRLKDNARRHKITPSVLIANTFSEILAQWCQSPKFTLNLTIFNRPRLHPQMNDLIGDFTSSVLLEVDMSERLPFEQSARNLQTRLMNDLEHRHFNGVEVLRAMNSQMGGYQAVVMPIVLTSALGLDQHSESKLAGLSREQLDTYEEMMKLGHTISQTSQVWLDHVVREKSGVLLCNWDALDELFPAGLLDDMFCGYYDRLIQLANEGDRAWQTERRMELPHYQEQKRRLVNGTDAPICNELLQVLFARMAREHPDNVAVINRNVTLSYHDLLVSASRLGRELRDLGAKPNQLVAVVMDKGWEQIVAVFGILFSGAAYMPVDAALPEERIRQLLVLGEISVCLTQAHLIDTIHWPDQVRPVVIGREQLAANRQSGASPVELAPAQSASDLAYVLFTSGSTGMPKGVMIDHASAVNTVLDINRRFDVTAQDRVLAINALNFDLSVYDVFGLLFAGGALVMPDYDRALDPGHWADLVVRERVTLWNTVPAIVQLYVDELEARFIDASHPAAADNRIRWVFMSGDWIPVSLPDRIRGAMPAAHPISLGGPTETTVWSICYPIGKVEPDWKSIPYGKPLENRSHQILHPDLSSCPDWVIGEICTGGRIGLSKGYWRDEEKTKLSFIIHPVTGERLYKTGDLGRFLPDGNIEFIGRVDNQVKIQGHRIELGEIEFALSRCDGVQEAVVMAVGDGPSTASKSNRRLVAYVVETDRSQDDQATANMLQSSAVLSSPLERAAFKLRQVGLRQLDEDHPAVELPYRAAKERPLRLRSLAYKAMEEVRELPWTKKTIALDDFGNWLSCLGQIRLDDAPMPKYYFPSAGSAYPIQTYIYLGPKAVESMTEGFYYYQPAKHQLVLMRDAAADVEQGGADRDLLKRLALSDLHASQFAVFMISNNAAIEPLYGDIGIERISALETGHIQALLSASAPDLHIGVVPHDQANSELLIDKFGLDGRYRAIQCLIGGGFDDTAVKGKELVVDCLARQSYRKFSQGRLQRSDFETLLTYCLVSDTAAAESDDASLSTCFPDLYVYVKPERIDGLPGGLYQFDLRRNRLVEVCEIRNGLAGNLQYSANRKIHAGSAFSFLFIRDRALSLDNENLLMAGYLAQSMINACTRFGIGLCPTGGAKIDLLRPYLSLPDSCEVFYCLEGGRIEVEQTRRWAHSDSMHQDDDQDWKDALRARLPYYMVPSAFVRVKSLPLTANGKVDRKALAALAQAGPAGDKLVVAPRTEIERAILAVWLDILELQQASVHDNLFELGGDSLVATKLIAEIGKLFDVNLPLHKLFTDPTIAGMAENYRSLLAEKGVDRAVQATSSDHGAVGAAKASELLVNFGAMTATLIEDARLDPEIMPTGFVAPNVDNPQTILLTGGAGFLGAYVLRELLEKTTADIYCLVRIGQSDSAQSRVEDNLKRYHLWQDKYSDRIEALQGDLSRERFGLDDAAYRYLCGNVDVIYHLGAQVNYARSYQDLKNTNVKGAESIIRLACRDRLKAVNFVSTKYVCFGLDDAGVKIHREEAPVTDPSGMFIGYTQSKWVAEKLFEQARQRGVPVSIFRPGQITGAASGPLIQPEDAFHHLVQLFISLDSRPDEDDWSDGVIDVVPVDFTASAIVAIGSQAASFGRHYHLVNPEPMPISVFLKLLARWRSDGETSDADGQKVVAVKSFAQWADDCLTHIHGMGDLTTAYVLEKFFVETEHGRFIRGLFLDGKFSTANVRDGLDACGIACPPVDGSLWSRYLGNAIKDADGGKGLEVKID